jgi:hypothetical protein
MEDIVGKIAFLLQPFTSENQFQFFEQYWSEGTEIFKQGILKMFAKILIYFSQNFSDKDDEFTGICLQTMMFGEAFLNEDKECCCNGEFHLLEKFNLLPLFRKFTENKFNIYFTEKSKMDIYNPEVKICKKNFVDKHKISALLCLFSQSEVM